MDICCNASNPFICNVPLPMFFNPISCIVWHINHYSFPNLQWPFSSSLCHLFSHFRFRFLLQDPLTLTTLSFVCIAHDIFAFVNEILLRVVLQREQLSCSLNSPLSLTFTLFTFHSGFPSHLTFGMRTETRMYILYTMLRDFKEINSSLLNKLMFTIAFKGQLACQLSQIVHNQMN